MISSLVNFFTWAEMVMRRSDAVNPLRFCRPNHTTPAISTTKMLIATITSTKVNPDAFFVRSIDILIARGLGPDRPDFARDIARRSIVLPRWRQPTIGQDDFDVVVGRVREALQVNLHAH